MHRILSFALVSCAIAASASAQTDIRANEWSHGTTVNGFAGVAVDSSNSGALLGGAMGWEVTPRLAIEGSGSWLEFGQGTSAFGGALKVRARLLRRRTADPFVQAGIGMYRASFASEQNAVPDFYAARMRDHMRITAHEVTFTDPTLIAGGGINVFVNRHLAIRPDVEATFVLRDRRSHVVTNIAVHLVYHFEHHPVTPSRKRFP